MYHLAGREPLSELNHETGDTVRFGTDGVEGPSGPVGGPTVTLREVGRYAAGDHVEGAALLDERESTVDAADLTERAGPTGNVTTEERRTVPRRVTEFAALAALAVVVLEVGYLRRRGEL